MVLSIFICLFCVVIETARGSCKKEELKTCKGDEYFDAILCLCSRCADICEPRPDKSTQTECQRNCPDYSQQTFTVRSFKEVTRVDHSKHFLNNTTVTVSTTVGLVVAQSLDNDPLIKKPLFWTSVVSVLISVVATIILIILCICKKSQPVRNLFCRRSPYPRPMEKLSVAQAETGSETQNFQGMVHSAEMYKSGFSNRYSISKDGYFISLSQDHCTECFMVQPETFSSGDLSSFVQKPGVASFEGPSLIRTSMIGFNLMEDKETELSLLMQSTLRNKCSNDYKEQAEQQFHMESLTNQKVPRRFSTESGFNDAGVSLVGCSVF